MWLWPWATSLALLTSLSLCRSEPDCCKDTNTFKANKHVLHAAAFPLLFRGAPDRRTDLHPFPMACRGRQGPPHLLPQRSLLWRLLAAPSLCLCQGAVLSQAMVTAPGHSSVCCHLTDPFPAPYLPSALGVSLRSSNSCFQFQFHLPYPGINSGGGAHGEGLHGDPWLH